MPNFYLYALYLVIHSQQLKPLIPNVTFPCVTLCREGVLMYHRPRVC